MAFTLTKNHLNLILHVIILVSAVYGQTQVKLTDANGKSYWLKEGDRIRYTLQNGATYRSRIQAVDTARIYPVNEKAIPFADIKTLKFKPAAPDAMVMAILIAIGTGFLANSVSNNYQVPVQFRIASIAISVLGGGILGYSLRPSQSLQLAEVSITAK